jgi:hypothetical protein
MREERRLADARYGAATLRVTSNRLGLGLNVSNGQVCGDFRFWHKADIPLAPGNVRFWR